MLVEGKCLLASIEEIILWHKRLGYVNIKKLTNLSKNDLVTKLPRLNLKFDHLCDACHKRKLTKNSFKSINVDILHIDLFGPSRTRNLGRKMHAFIIVNDYSRFTWVFFFAHKYEKFNEFVKFCKKIQKQTSFTIIKILSIKVRNLKMSILQSFVMSMALSMIFHSLGLQLKMVLWNERTGHYKKWLEPCCVI